MTVKTLLQFVTSPIKIRSGRRSIFAKISDHNVRDHLGEEVWMIRARGNVLEVYCEVPSYELDNDADLTQEDLTQEDLTEDEAPWD